MELTRPWQKITHPRAYCKTIFEAIHSPLAYCLRTNRCRSDTQVFVRVDYRPSNISEHSSTSTIVQLPKNQQHMYHLVEMSSTNFLAWRVDNQETASLVIRVDHQWLITEHLNSDKRMWTNDGQCWEYVRISAFCQSNYQAAKQPPGSSLDPKSW